MPETARTANRPGFWLIRPDEPRTDLPWAGWSDEQRMTLSGGPFQSLSWGNLRTLAAAYREKLVRFYTIQPDAAMRQAWMHEQLPYESVRRTVKVRTPLAVAPRTVGGVTRVILTGDTGDGSQAQRAVSLQMRGRAVHPGSAFQKPGVAALLIQSDVVYPAGAGSEYRAKFFAPYHELLAQHIPIYAVPGNHDWDDGSLIGFMGAFCGVEALPGSVPDARKAVIRGGLGGLPGRPWPTGGAVAAGHPSPSGTDPGSRQPGPYFALDIGGALYIGIDTGYDGVIDIEQAEWLVKIVEDHPDQPKLLFTGKPLIVQGHRAPCRFTPLADNPATDVQSACGGWYASVDDIVRRPENGFVAVLGGDVHNYERYLAHMKAAGSDERVLPYVVCGGGGVFIGQTYWYPEIAIDESAGAQPDHVSCGEEETVLFPTRRHSTVFVQALIRRSRRQVRFTLPIVLIVAATLTLLLAFVNSIFRGHLHAQHGEAGLALVFAAVAVNISARPIRPRAQLLSVALGVLAAAFTWWPDAPQRVGNLSAAETRDVVALGMAAGVGLIVAADLRQLPLRPRRWLSSVGGLAVLAAAGADLWASAPISWWSRGWAIAIAALSLLAVVGVTDGYHRGPIEPPTDADSELAPKNRLAAWLGRHQRSFSIYETFNDGRLRDHVKLRFDDGVKRVTVPLYRSFMEIEYRCDGADGWDFAFTAFGVTGENNTDVDNQTAQQPRMIDAFDVHWKPHRVTFSPPAGG